MQGEGHKCSQLDVGKYKLIFEFSHVSQSIHKDSFWQSVM